MTRRLLLALLFLALALPAGAQELDWLAKSVPPCTDGAVTRACKCNGVKVTSGYCHAGLLGEPSGVFDHVYWDGTAQRDTFPLPWAMNGTVPQVAASGSIPAGAGPYSSSNNYSLAAANKGGWAITGDHWFCAAVKVPSIAGYNSIVTNGAYTLTAFPSTGYVSAAFTGGTDTSAGGVSVAGALNVVCWGQAGTKARITVNGGIMVESNVSAVVSPTGDNVTLGRIYSLGGSIHEIVGVSGTPTELGWRPLVWSVLQANGAKTWLAYGDSITNNATRQYPAQVVDTLNAGWVLTNRALPGTSVWVMRIDWDTYSEGGPWKIVSLQGGFNDLGSLRTAEQIYGDYEYMMGRARANGMKILVVGFLPFGHSGSWTQAKEDIRTSVNASLSAYGAAHPDDVAVIDLGPLTDTGIYIPAAYDNGDGVHWSNAGHTAIAAQVYASGHAKGWF